MNLRDFTSARVGLERAGNSLPTQEFLKLQLAHARARDAVHSRLNIPELAAELESAIVVRSAAMDRPAYLKRPDRGRKLSEESRQLLRERRGDADVVFVIADGLSATAVQKHAVPFLEALGHFLPASDWTLAPIVIAEQARVAIGDEIGECLGARLSVVLIGERPGLSSFDSLGVYMTWHPHSGLTDADRNCISNIRAEGLTYAAAAHKLAFLMTESRRRKLSGIQLKEDALLLDEASNGTALNDRPLR